MITTYLALVQYPNLKVTTELASSKCSVEMYIRENVTLTSSAINFHPAWRPVQIGKPSRRGLEQNHVIVGNGSTIEGSQNITEKLANRTSSAARFK